MTAWRRGVALTPMETRRDVLGLGASTRALVEGFHDTAFEHPAAKLRAVTTKVRTLLAGEPAHLDTVPGARPLRLGQRPAPELPIWLAAMGDRTLPVAAELGDGWFPAMVAHDRLAGWVARLNQLREAASRRAPTPTVAAGPMIVVDDDPRTARGVAASCTAWYLGAMGDVYARFVSDQGYGDEVKSILAANPHPSPKHGVVPAEAQVVLDQLSAYGTPDQVRDRPSPTLGGPPIDTYVFDFGPFTISGAPGTVKAPPSLLRRTSVAADRPVVSVTTAPSGFEGEGFPVRRAFAGVPLPVLDPFVHMDQMGEVEYAPGEPKGTPRHPTALTTRYPFGRPSTEPAGGQLDEQGDRGRVLFTGTHRERLGVAGTLQPAGAPLGPHDRQRPPVPLAQPASGDVGQRMARPRTDAVPLSRLTPPAPSCS